MYEKSSLGVTVLLVSSRIGICTLQIISYYGMVVLSMGCCRFVLVLVYFVQIATFLSTYHEMYIIDSIAVLIGSPVFTHNARTTARVWISCFLVVVLGECCYRRLSMSLLRPLIVVNDDHFL